MHAVVFGRQAQVLDALQGAGNTMHWFRFGSLSTSFIVIVQ